MKSTTYFLLAFMSLLVCCGQPAEESKLPKNKTEKDTITTETAKQEIKKENDQSNETGTKGIRDFSNKIVVYKNNEGHELRLEIMGQNHETFWYYDNGQETIQVIPMIGENDYYALLDNEGENVGFMQLNKIDEENDFRIAAEIELSMNQDKQKSLFRLSEVIE